MRARVRRSGRARLQFEKLEPITVKGKKHPVKIFNPYPAALAPMFTQVRRKAARYRHHRAAPYDRARCVQPGTDARLGGGPARKSSQPVRIAEPFRARGLL
jgi:hypothetical protein